MLTAERMFKKIPEWGRKTCPANGLRLGKSRTDQSAVRTPVCFFVAAGARGVLRFAQDDNTMWGNIFNFELLCSSFYFDRKTSPSFITN